MHPVHIGGRCSQYAFLRPKSQGRKGQNCESITYYFTVLTYRNGPEIVGFFQRLYDIMGLDHTFVGMVVSKRVRVLRLFDYSWTQSVY
jgi:hypothetical protein